VRNGDVCVTLRSCSRSATSFCFIAVADRISLSIREHLSSCRQAYSVFNAAFRNPTCTKERGYMSYYERDEDLFLRFSNQYICLGNTDLPRLARV
jgi:hypothetical protein